MTIMKIGLTLAVCFMATLSMQAQSFIITKNADTLRVYDVEIGYTSVYFKASRDKDATLERLSKTKIDHLILTDGQQFTFDGRTPVKEENKTFSVLLRGDRGEVEKKDRKKNKFVVWNARQWGVMFDYAWKEYNFKDEETDADDNYLLSGINAQFQIWHIQMGVSHFGREFEYTHGRKPCEGRVVLTNLNFGAHYRFWLRSFFVDPSLGFSYTYFRKESKENYADKTYSRKEYNGAYFYPRVGFRFSDFIGVSFAANVHFNSKAPTFCSAGLSLVPFKIKRQR